MKENFWSSGTRRVIIRRTRAGKHSLWPACAVVGLLTLTLPLAADAARPKARPASAVPTGPLEAAEAPPVPIYSSRGAFTFAVLGNTAPPSPGMPMPPAALQIVDDLNFIRPDFVIHTGNFTWVKPGDAAGAQAQVDRFRTGWKKLSNTPLYIAPGSKDVPDEDADVVFRKAVYGTTSWRSFDYRGNHFIVLDTEVPNQAGKISGDQLTWLQGDLEAHQQAGHTFVFLNRTPYPTGVAPAGAAFASDTERDAFAALMTRYKVHSVFSGGQPGYSASVHDGVNYVNTAGGGGPLTTSPTEGGFIHYVLVSVDGDRVDENPLQPGQVDVKFEPTDSGFLVNVYNNSPVPIVMNGIPVGVPWQWRTKHATGLLGADRLAIYHVDASTSSGGTSGAADAAVVGLQEAPTRDPFDADVLTVRTAVPADSAVTLKVKLAQ